MHPHLLSLGVVIFAFIILFLWFGEITKVIPILTITAGILAIATQMASLHQIFKDNKQRFVGGPSVNASVAKDLKDEYDRRAKLNKVESPFDNNAPVLGPTGKTTADPHVKLAATLLRNPRLNIHHRAVTKIDEGLINHAKWRNERRSQDSQRIGVLSLDTMERLFGAELNRQENRQWWGREDDVGLDAIVAAQGRSRSTTTSAN